MHEMWRRARDLGGREDLEWTFPVNGYRGYAVVDPVTNFFYEPLSSWDEAVLALRMDDLLRSEDASGRDTVGGITIGLGLEVYESFYKAPGGRVSVAASTERFHGRHWVRAVAEVDEDTIAFANSWGEKWGDHGRGYISRDFFEAHVDSVFAARVLFAGTSPAMDQRLRELHWTTGQPHGTDLRLWARAWPTPNPRRVWKLDVRGKTFDCWYRTVFSLKDNYPAVHVFELVDQNDLVGRSHVIHHPGSDLAVLEEIWVPPDRRRKGFGTAVAAEAERLARSRRSTRLEVPLFEADAKGDRRDGAAAFALSLGFTWTWKDSRRPNAVGVAGKDLLD